MPRGPSKEYTGRGGHWQVRVSDDEDRELKSQAKAAGFKEYGPYLRFLVKQAAGKVPVPILQDPIRSENRDIHKRFEAIWNSLNEIEREALEGVLDRFSPKSKGKRAS